MQPYTIIIFGPTAVGKTDFALSLAQNLPIEIINMDVGQLYEPLSLGTAKPDWRASTVPHHLFDVLDRPVNYTVVQYRAAVQSLLQDIHARNKIPVLVGGSSFYLKSLFYPPRAQTLGKNLTDSNDDWAWEQLHAIDPVRAAQIHPNDTYRIMRALQIWHQTGMLPSQQEPRCEPIARCTLVHLMRDRAQLYERINMRVVQMIEQGWIDEVCTLRGTDWESFLYEKKIIGYDDLLRYCASGKTSAMLDEVIEIIQQKTRNYAKRQEIFWRGLQKRLSQEPDQARWLAGIWVMNLTFAPVELYIKQLLCHIREAVLNKK